MKKIINIVTTFIIATFSFSAVATAVVAVNANAATCGGVEVSYLSAICDDSKSNSTGSGGNANDIGNSGLWKILAGTLDIMMAGVGILAVGGIVYGAILYASAQDSSAQVQKAIDMIRNVVIGLVSFALMYSVTQFLVPGGVF